MSDIVKSDISPHIPAEINKSDLLLILDGSVSTSNVRRDQELQTSIDMLSRPKETVTNVLHGALLGLYNRSTLLYEQFLNAKTIEEKEIYLRYYDKFMSRIPQIADSITKLTNGNQQNMTVEHINVESGAQAVIGNISNKIPNKDHRGVNDKHE